MKGLVKFINEGKYSPKDYKTLGKRWYDKCYNLSIAGSFDYTEPRLTFNDFEGFLDDFERLYKVPTENDRWSRLARARYNIGKAIRNGEIEKVRSIAEHNEVDKFTYSAHPAADYVYGSYFLDCYLVFATYEYITNGNLIIRNGIMKRIWDFDRKYDWYKDFEKNVEMLYKSVPGNN